MGPSPGAEPPRSLQTCVLPLGLDPSEAAWCCSQYWIPVRSCSSHAQRKVPRHSSEERLVLPGAQQRSCPAQVPASLWQFTRSKVKRVCVLTWFSSVWAWTGCFRDSPVPSVVALPHGSCAVPESPSSPFLCLSSLHILPPKPLRDQVPHGSSLGPRHGLWGAQHREAVGLRGVPPVTFPPCSWILNTIAPLQLF